MSKISIMGFKYIRNFGDPVIIESATYLVEKCLDELNFSDTKISTYDVQSMVDFDKYDRLNFIQYINFYLRKILKYFLVIVMFIFPSKYKNYFELLIWRISHNRYRNIIYYRKNLIDSKLLIFAGGGIIKYKYQDMSFICKDICDFCEKYNIPVMFNAVGVEGFDLNNAKCIDLKNTLNSEIIKVITTRDDIGLLSNQYISNKSVIIDKVADSAVYISDIHVLHNKKKYKVGLNIARSNIFLDNGFNVTKRELIVFWNGIIKYLDENKISWAIFCNGDSEDYKFVEEIARINTLDSNKIMRIPLTSNELIDSINRFEYIIASRLHACIISYSYNIPVMGLVWNEKLKFFGKQIKKSEYFVDSNNLNFSFAINLLNQMFEEKEFYDVEFRETYKATTYEYLKYFIGKYLK